MKKILIFIALLCSTVSKAQLQLTPYIDEENCLSMPNGICQLLTQKLTSIIMQNGLQSQMGQSRFVLTCIVTEESKDVLTTVPTQIAYVLNLHMFIGDGETGTKYVTQSFRVKGVGKTEEKAYRNAVKNLSSKSEAVSLFVDKGKSRILDYYENNKSQILSSINSAIASKDLERASYELFLIPQECSYYIEVLKLLGEVNGLIIDNQSSELLLSARSIWTTKQDEESAKEVTEIISQIDPNASCYSDAIKFIKSVQTRLEKINNREWTANQRQLSHEREMEMARERNRTTEKQMTIKAQTYQNLAKIKAARDVAVEYAKKRPQIVYHVSGWN